jgi:very-short-patch-repair endonuclease
MTEAEKRLWFQLRNRRLDGFKFKRQEWIGPYIADFLCPQARLIVEVDGSQHGDRTGYDRDRDAYLTLRGYRVLRFWNNEVMGDIEAVLTAIRAALGVSLPSPSHAAAPRGPLPLPEREREKDGRRSPSPLQGEGGAQSEALGG